MRSYDRIITILALFYLFLCYAADASQELVLFSNLPQTLVVPTTIKPGQVLKAGEDNITVSWGLNKSIASKLEKDETLYKTVKLKLCYAPESQVDRPWRKTTDNLSKDKTCQFTIVTRPFDNSTEIESFQWQIETDIPQGQYFVRAYVYGPDGKEIAFGQTTDSVKNSNLFEVKPISGRHLWVEVASVCLSGFAWAALMAFLLLEKCRHKGAAKTYADRDSPKVLQDTFTYQQLLFI